MLGEKLKQVKVSELNKQTNLDIHVGLHSAEAKEADSVNSTHFAHANTRMKTHTWQFSATPLAPPLVGLFLKHASSKEK